MQILIGAPLNKDSSKEINNSLVNEKVLETTKNKRVKLEKDIGGRNIIHTNTHNYSRGMTSGYSFHSKSNIKSEEEKEIRSKSTTNRYPEIRDSKMHDKIIPLLDIKRGRVKSINLDLFNVKPILEVNEQRTALMPVINDYATAKENSISSNVSKDLLKDSSQLNRQMQKRKKDSCRSKVINSFGTVATSIQSGDKFQLTEIGFRATPYFKLITSEQEKVNKVKMENNKKSKTKWESFETIQVHENKMYNKLNDKFNTTDEIETNLDTIASNCCYDKKFDNLLKSIVNIGNRKVESHLNMLEFNNGKYQMKQKYNYASKYPK